METSTEKVSTHSKNSVFNWHPVRRGEIFLKNDKMHQLQLINFHMTKVRSSVKEFLFAYCSSRNVRQKHIMIQAGLNFCVKNQPPTNNTTLRVDVTLWNYLRHFVTHKRSPTRTAQWFNRESTGGLNIP